MCLLQISIIIPTFNEASVIEALIKYLQQHSAAAMVEIIVSDGGSTDKTLAIAAATGATALTSPQKGRAAQMNYGASKAGGDILYFVHADSFPPVNFVNDITDAVTNGFDCGRYKTKFNSSNWLLKINAWFTRFDWFICNGGDQTFFVTKKLFDQLHGFNSNMQIMEEYDLVPRAKEKGRFKIFKSAALVSARKYEGRSWWQVQMANKKAVQLFKKGASQQEIAAIYTAMLKIK